MDLSIEGAVVALLPGTAVGVRHAGGRRITQGSGRVLLQALGGPALVALEDGIELEQRLLVERTRGELRGLSDHILKDIGLRRTEIDCLVR